jgi:Spy/CpxP family protein refolding chaperone
MSGILKFSTELTIAIVCLATGSGRLLAQPPGMPPPPPPPSQRGRGDGLQPPPPGQHPRQKLGPPGRWWDDPAMAKKIGLSADQVKKMDDVFQSFRPKLIELNGMLRSGEAELDPLVQSNETDDSKLLPVIDRVANARAELEKVNARMLIGIRHVLTNQQWKKVQSEDMGGAAQDDQQRRPKRQHQ